MAGSRKGAQELSGAGHEVIVGLRGAGKQFAGTWVLKGVDLAVRSGEILALVGENGAGKSTIVKTFAGIHRPDAGTVTLDGQPVQFSSPRVSQAASIEVIHQHPNLFPDLSIAENIYLANPPRTRRGGLDKQAMRRGAQEVLSRLGVRITVTRPVSGLSLADQQLVEIAKALSVKARVLILDEPTAALSAHEVERLFRIVRELRDDGVAIMMVNHRLEEVFALCDRITIIRDGRHVVTAPIEDVSTAECISYMVGREISGLFPSRKVDRGDVALHVTNLNRRGEFRDISFDVRRGEIVGMAGLIGAGRTEIARAIFGADNRSSGSVVVNGKPVNIQAPADAVKVGIAYVPEDRHRSGLALDLTVEDNLSLPRLKSMSRWLVIDRKSEHRLVVDYIRRLSIRTSSPSAPVSSLSGGNQQKVVISRWLSTNPSILILDEPTQGIDIGAKSEVHRIISELAEAGMAILLISSDLLELLGLADRVLVVRDGKLVGELSQDDANQQSVMELALGDGVSA